MKKNKNKFTWYCKKNINDSKSKTLNNIFSLQTKKLNINIKHYRNLHTKKAKQIEKCYRFF